MVPVRRPTLLLTAQGTKVDNILSHNRWFFFFRHFDVTRRNFRYFKDTKQRTSTALKNCKNVARFHIENYTILYLQKEGEA